MRPEEQDLLLAGMAWMDPWWDPEAGLLWNPPGAYENVTTAARQVHMVRETGWYALGLLARDKPGDRARAAQALASIAALQYDNPGTPWHGTFPRFPTDPHPEPGARIWVDYDPNWRQFIGTTLATIRLLHDDRVPADVTIAVDRAIERAVAGEPPDRVAPTYANIALMRAWLEEFHAGRAGDDHARRAAHTYAAEVVAAFDEHGAFAEYNSPTYYAVDLLALALWRSLSPPDSPLVAWGQRLEAALWEDLARFWHADLGNAAGPYSRAYGMDLNAYLGGLSVWLWAGLGRAAAPLPPLEGEVPHGHDLCQAPAVALAGARIPDAVADAFRRFGGERSVERQITTGPERVATAWLGTTAMMGAERQGADGRIRAYGQYHPATLHWRLPDGGVGWARVEHHGVVQATAAPQRLVVDVVDTAAGPVRWHVHAPGSGRDAVTLAGWSLPGLEVVVTTDGVLAGVDLHDSGFTATYDDATTVTLELVGPPA